MNSRIGWVSLVLLISLCIAACQSEPQQVSHGTSFYEATVVAAYIEHEIPRNANLVFCTTFQIAWNKLKDDIIKDAITMVEQPGMVDFLNTGKVGAISNRDYVADAGSGGDNIVMRVNAALAEKFGEAAPVLDIELEDDEILAYAYLFKQLLFAEKFEEIEGPMLFQGSDSASVSMFGIEKYDPALHEAMGKQVEILDYADDLDFVLGLTTEGDDIMVLAKVKPEKTLLGTFKAVERRVASGEHDMLKKDDVFEVPKIAFDIDHSFDELLNKQLKNEGFTEYFFAKATQSILFSLDEQGVLLESDATLILKKNGSERRYFIFNQPFLLYLKERGAAYPYFALWVNDPEILVKPASKEKR